MSSYEDWKFTQSRLYTMKLKYTWLICLGYILEPPLNPFKAHIELQMSSYENIKAIKLIDLFLVLHHYIRPLGSCLVFKYKGHKPPASDWLWTGQKKHHWTFALEQHWIAEKLGHLKYRVRICSKTTWLDFWCIL